MRIGIRAHKIQSVNKNINCNPSLILEKVEIQLTGIEIEIVKYRQTVEIGLHLLPYRFFTAIL